MNEMGQAPLFAALVEHKRRSAGNFHLPGHKGNLALPPEMAGLSGRELAALDLTELPGLDDLHRPSDVIARALALTAEVYGAARSCFLVNGSTVGIHALLLAVGGSGKVLLPRHCHRAVLGGLILSGAEPVYLTPLPLERFGFAAGVSPEQVTAALTDRQDVSAILTVRPNYYGVADDLPGQKKAAREAGVPLLVDEAHGAHLRFHPELPKDAMACGADAAVQSAHKMSLALTQSAMLHMSNGFPKIPAVVAALDILQTTSPSYLLMASLDLARRRMALQGAEGLGSALRLARKTRRRLADIKGLTVLTKEYLPPGWSLDETKLVVATDGLGLTGYQAVELLADRYRIFLEMADQTNIVAVLSPASKPEECDALVAALEDITRRDRLTPGARPVLPRFSPPEPVIRMKPRDAWFAAREGIPLELACGRICAESAAVYPPGVPAVYPGEEITPATLEYLLAVRKLNLPSHGSSDPMLKTIEVVIE